MKGPLSHGNLPPTSLSPAEEISLGEGARSEPVSVAPLLRLNRSGEGSQDLLSEAIVVGYDVNGCRAGESRV